MTKPETTKLTDKERLENLEKVLGTLIAWLPELGLEAQIKLFNTLHANRTFGNDLGIMGKP